MSALTNICAKYEVITDFLVLFSYTNIKYTVNTKLLTNNLSDISKETYDPYTDDIIFVLYDFENWYICSARENKILINLSSLKADLITITHNIIIIINCTKGHMIVIQM